MPKEADGTLHVFRVEADEEFWIIARTREEARQIYNGLPEAQVDASEVRREHDRKLCVLLPKEGGSGFSVVAAGSTEISEWKANFPEAIPRATIKSFGELAAEKGPGLLGSTV